jgi:sugar phosphate isomerase/epimerase
MDEAGAHPPFALSTMWAMQPRFEHDVLAFTERAAELGYEAIEINPSMDAQMAGAILAGGALPVASIHAPAPLEQHPTAGWNRDLNLASLDEGERSLAVRFAQRSIDLASQAGARYVVLHIGRVSDHELPGERRLRELYPRRDLVPDEWERTVDDTVRERAALVAPYLDSARRSLDELVAYAEPRGVALGIESMQPFHQLALPQEAAGLLEPYPAHVAGYWHDVGHVEVLHRLGLVDRSAWFDLLGERLIGVHLHDMRGLTDHRAPGSGDVDFKWLASRIPARAARTLEIDQHEPDESLVRAIEVLREAGVS